MIEDELLKLLGGLDDKKLLGLIDSLPEGQRDHLASIALEYGDALKRERGQERFMEFVKVMWPNFIGGRHHEVMADRKSTRLNSSHT